jgi:hypothetical protein
VRIADLPRLHQKPGANGITEEVITMITSDLFYVTIAGEFENVASNTRFNFGLCEQQISQNDRRCTASLYTEGAAGVGQLFALLKSSLKYTVGI